MRLKQWADYGWLKSHKTTLQEISNLLGIVDRDQLLLLHWPQKWPHQSPKIKKAGLVIGVVA
jgi:hypothetical protein